MKTRPLKQPGLFDKIVTDPSPAMKASMNEVLKACKKSREQVADEMAELAMIAGITCNGRSKKVSVDLLNKWVAPGAASYTIPIRLLPIFCRVIGSNLPLQVYSSFFDNVQVISKDDHKQLKWAKAEISARQSRKKASKLAHEVGL